MKKLLFLLVSLSVVLSACGLVPGLIPGLVPTATATATVTDTPTITITPTPVPTNTPTATSTPLYPTAGLARQLSNRLEPLDRAAGCRSGLASSPPHAHQGFEPAAQRPPAVGTFSGRYRF